jgi:hypothetical protein
MIMFSQGWLQVRLKIIGELRGESVRSKWYDACMEYRSGEIFFGFPPMIKCHQILNLTIVPNRFKNIM